MMLVLPPVARSVLMECTKCGRETYFRVLAHTSDTAAKCECEICKTKKTYRLKSAVSRPKSSFAKGEKKTKVTSSRQVWLDLKEKYSAKTSKSYSMKGSFFLFDVVDHPKFGVGIVTESNARKVQIVFEEGTKDLLHNCK